MNCLRAVIDFYDSQSSRVISWCGVQQDLLADAACPAVRCGSTASPSRASSIGRAQGARCRGPTSGSGSLLCMQTDCTKTLIFQFIKDLGNGDNGCQKITQSTSWCAHCLKLVVVRARSGPSITTETTSVRAHNRMNRWAKRELDMMTRVLDRC